MQQNASLAFSLRTLKSITNVGRYRFFDDISTCIEKLKACQFVSKIDIMISSHVLNDSIFIVINLLEFLVLSL